ncbi:MAG: DUF805 domain-containing protein [Proteobacteria bacterium]|nr:DUF805 domain-containing protein [Pseudomonadota bacterium]
MAFPIQDSNCVGRSAYWTYFAVNLVVVAGLLTGMVALLFSGHFAMAVLCLFLVLPAGLYFRVIMMRRCRDIGWPAALPWLLFGLGVFANMTRFFHGVEGLRNPGVAPFPMLVGLADFAFMIAIGCIQGRGQSDYARYFEPDEDDRLGQVPRPATPMAARPMAQRPVPQGHDADLPQDREQQEAIWDAAIARALAKQDMEARQEVHRPATPAPRTPGPPRPAGGFGRRVT